MGHHNSSTKHYRSHRQQISTACSSIKKGDCGRTKLEERITMLVCLRLWLTDMCQSQTYSSVSLTDNLICLLKPLAERSKGIVVSAESQEEITTDATSASDEQSLPPKSRLCRLANSGICIPEAKHGLQDDRKTTDVLTVNLSTKSSVKQQLNTEDTAKADVQRNNAVECPIRSGEQTSTSCYTFNLKTNRYEAGLSRDDYTKRKLVSSLPDVEVDLKKLLQERTNAQAFLNHNAVYTVCVVQNSAEFEPLLTIIDRMSKGERVPPQVTMRYEMLRFCTLRSYPRENKPYITRLAQAGFYYANNGDEVVCYSCARRRSSWRETDNPMDVHRELNPNCRFLTRNSEVNVPIRSQTQRNQVTSNTQQEHTTSAEHEEVSSTEVASATTEDRTELGPTSTEQASEIPVQPNHPNAQTTENRSLSNPKYPKYSSKVVRQTSFRDCNEIAVSRERLAEAGFFYAGFEDCVRCFQCGVGLRHWSEEDDPWIEHSRWAKDCSYVRHITGVEFVNLVQMAVQYSQSENTEEQSTARQPSGAEGDDILHSDAAQSVLEMGYQPDTVRQAVRTITDRGINITAASVMEQIFEIEEADEFHTSISRDIEAQQNSQTAASQTATSPSTTSRDQDAQQNRQTTTSRGTDARQSPQTSTSRDQDAQQNPQTSTSRGTDARQSPQTSTSRETSAQQNLQTSTSRGIDARQNASAAHTAQLLEKKKLKEENEKLKRQSKCTKCKRKEVCIVFLPCGHLVTCEDCAPTVRSCTEPACGRYIKGTVRTYLA